MLQVTLLQSEACYTGCSACLAPAPDHPARRSDRCSTQMSSDFDEGSTSLPKHQLGSSSVVMSLVGLPSLFLSEKCQQPVHAVSSDREPLRELKHSRAEHSLLILVQGSSASQCTACITGFPGYLFYNNACYSQAFGLVVFVGAQELLALSVESTVLARTAYWSLTLASGS